MAVPTSSPDPAATPKKTPIYEASSQYNNWRFSPERLEVLRRTMNEAAVTAIRRTLETHEPGSSSDVSFLTADEEHILVKHYITKITPLCGLFSFPEELAATAVSYMKRFYLKNTVMDWHPKNVMLTTLFLATKTTNNPISIEKYTQRIRGTNPSDVLDIEFLVCQSLGFEFAVWHAHRALWGIWLDFQDLPNMPADWASTRKSQYEEALEHVRASRLSDVELIYSPSQIALAAMSLVFPAESDTWLSTKYPAESLHAIQTVVETIKTIMTQACKAPEVETVRNVDRRLRTCKNPEKVVGSKAYLARQAEDERKDAEKRARKAENVTQDDDPFGSEMKDTPMDDDDDD
ncbi:cyclin-like protein [Cylindrobasidium torrendii FP15055 ss-10]|uniref:Cyclin-like protein n=1 Tax=Cylindrobasidium torrendii FP15055 ss-10 TaxID=1314674 RepID=A0A0D7B0B0_9AGAR|nr:cyclin-like protein [Cylindrobasidium torrendii FP15055 ss-10]